MGNATLAPSVASPQPYFTFRRDLVLQGPFNLSTAVAPVILNLDGLEAFIRMASNTGVFVHNLVGAVPACFVCV